MQPMTKPVIQCIDSLQMYVHSQTVVLQRSLCKKNEELEKAYERIKTLEKGHSECHEKLAVFMIKREEQHKQEKQKWIRKYNHMRSFKGANFKLSHTSRRLRLRESKLTPSKRSIDEISSDNAPIADDLPPSKRQKLSTNKATMQQQLQQPMQPLPQQTRSRKKQPLNNNVVHNSHEPNDLQMYVRSQTEMKCAIQKLKKAMKNEEIEFRGKMHMSEKKWCEIIRKLHKQNESLNFIQTSTNEELIEQQKKSGELQELLRRSEARNIVLESQAQARNKELHLLKHQCKQIRSQFASIKHKYDTFGCERRAMVEQIRAEKSKNSYVIGELNKKTSEIHTERVLFKRKNEELEKAFERIKALQNGNSECQESLRAEFDEKLAVFVLKCKQEKREWMRKYNGKFKQANFDLFHANQRLEGDNKELRLVASKLKQSKVELEHKHCSLEQKMGSDLDDFRLRTDHAIKQEKVLIRRFNHIISAVTGESEPEPNSNPKKPAMGNRINYKSWKSKMIKKFRFIKCVGHSN